MKILYYYFEGPGMMDLWKKHHFIDELNRNGICVDSFNPLLYSSYDEANCQLLDLIKKRRYDLFVASTCDERVLFQTTIKEIKRIGVATLAIRFDNLVIPYRDKIMSPLFDLVWLTSKETKHFYEKWGAKSFFAPYAANPYTFNYSKGRIIRRACFIGTPYGSRSIMINQLTTNGIESDIYFKKDGIVAKETKEASRLKIPSYNRIWDYYNRLSFYEGRRMMLGSFLNKIKGQTSLIENDCFHGKPQVPFIELAGMYSKYALSLASTSAGHTDILQTPLKIINLRNFEIPMSGGIEICRYNAELAEYFLEGKEIVFYKDNDELIEKAKYYLKHATDNELAQMKEAARRRAESEHTWMNRFSIAFEKLGLKLQ